MGFLLMLLMALTWQSASGHGRLAEPPSRSSMWRYGFNTPKNYDDNGLNCGGLNTQWYVNGGKCGVCGDPWGQPPPRDNEAGGLYGKGIITRHYTPGQTIDIRIEVTANHRGWFEFRLCAHNSPTTPITQQCLDQHLLELADGSGTQYTLNPTAGFVELKLKLPPGLTCTQCVLQWKWHAGNNAGNIQEEFYGCSDVAIGTSQSGTTAPTVPPTIRPTIPHTYRPSSTSGGSYTGPCHAVSAYQGRPDVEQFCNEQCPKGNCPPLYCSCSGTVTAQPTTAPPTAPPTVTPIPTSAGACRGINAWHGIPELDLYCNEQCPKGNCPSEYCSCSSTITIAPPTAPPTVHTTAPPKPTSGGACRGINAWHGIPELDLYCNEQCPKGNCPSEYCSCSNTGQTISVPPTAHPTVASTAPPTVASTAPPKATGSLRCQATGQWQGLAMLDAWCRENCANGLCPADTCKCHHLTSPPHTTSPAPPIQVVSQSPSGACHGINEWQGMPELDRYCQEQCPLGNCPALYCSCTGQPLVPSTALPSQQTPRLNPTTTAALRCVAIGSWQGDVRLDQWCNDNCPTGICPAESCRCGMHPTAPPSTAPPTASSAHTNSTICYAINGWAGNVQLDQYCSEECRNGFCPPQYCACGPRDTLQATPQPQATPRPAATATPMTPQSQQCRAINTWQGVAELDLWCRTECAVGNCPPSYCHCDP